MAAFDLETTGVAPETARIVTASIVIIEGRALRPREWFVDPGIDIPLEATAVHGITTEYAREHGQPAADAVLDIAVALDEQVQAGRAIVIYNAPYDLTVLDRELRRHYQADGKTLWFTPMVIDPLVLDRAMEPYRKGSGTRKLTYVCNYVYGVPLSEEDAHGSAADALAAARVAWKIAHRYPDCGQLSLDELQTKQAEWHRDWANDFAEYLVRQGKPDDVDRSWPIRPFPEPQAALIPEVEVPAHHGGLL